MQPLTLKQQTKALVRSFLQLGIPYAECVEAFKKEFIVLVLVAHRGDQCRAARDLGMHRNTLGRTLAELKIDARLIRSVRSAAGLPIKPRSTPGIESRPEVPIKIQLEAREALHNLVRR